MVLSSNNGFTSAILSIVGLILSVIAIIVSINTSKLSYKRKALKKTRTSYQFDGEKSYLYGYMYTSTFPIDYNPINFHKLMVSSLK